MWNDYPKKFGTLHIIFIALVVLVLVASCIFGSHFSDEKYEAKRARILSYIGIGLMGLEIIKIIYTIAVGEGTIALIPFQICSLPLYVLPFLPLMKKGWIKETALGLCSSVVLFSGIAYFVNPSAMVKTLHIFLSLHSGFYHCIICGVGAFILTSYRFDGKRGFRGVSFGYVAFIFCSLIAVSANLIAHAVDPNSPLWLFYLHPDCPTTFPIIDMMIKPYVPFVVYYIIFLVSFYILGLLPSGISTLVRFIVQKIKSKQEVPQTPVN